MAAGGVGLCVLHERSLAISRELGDRRGEGETLLNIGLLAHDTGDLATARRRWQEALTALDGLGVPEEEDVRNLLAELDEAESPREGM